MSNSLVIWTIFIRNWFLRLLIQENVKNLCGLKWFWNDMSGILSCFLYRTLLTNLNSMMEFHSRVKFLQQRRNHFQNTLRLFIYFKWIVSNIIKVTFGQSNGFFIQFNCDFISIMRQFKALDLTSWRLILC